MKNSEIHLGLPNAIMRDFLAMAMIKNHNQSCENKKEFLPRLDGEYFDWAVKDCEREIEFQKRRLINIKETCAILTLIKSQGWKEFDVSDETENDTGEKLHLNFIGTEEEYQELLSKIKKIK